MLSGRLRVERLANYAVVHTYGCLLIEYRKNPIFGEPIARRKLHSPWLVWGAWADRVSPGCGCRASCGSGSSRTSCSWGPLVELFSDMRGFHYRIAGAAGQDLKRFEKLDYRIPIVIAQGLERLPARERLAGVRQHRLAHCGVLPVVSK